MEEGKERMEEEKRGWNNRCKRENGKGKGRMEEKGRRGWKKIRMGRKRKIMDEGKERMGKGIDGIKDGKE
jgi:hypothetical protein